MSKLYCITTLFLIVGQSNLFAQDSMIYNIIDEVSSERIEKDITKLVSFGTRPVSYTHLTLPTSFAV